MKKALLFVVIAILLVIFSGCTRMETVETVEENKIFKLVERYNSFLVVCDSETNVMYAVSFYGAGSGVFTMLVNADGTPKLWKGV